MDDALTKLRATAEEAIEPFWYAFAKNGNESAVLAPLRRYPNASAWLARSMATSADCITRKLAAMLAGWVQHPRYVALLGEMLDSERRIFRQDTLSANSVGEDIMFSATRWAESQDPQVRNSGIEVLARMVSDALEGTSWNTANWAMANLYRMTKGDHPVLKKLADASGSQIEGQEFLQSAARALRQNDTNALDRLFAAPSELSTLSSTDPHYAAMSSLWQAAASAEESLGRRS